MHIKTDIISYEHNNKQYTQKNVLYYNYSILKIEKKNTEGIVK